jgi:hypothetical protein
MKKLATMLRTGPVIVGEFRGGKSEPAKRFDKTDKNAAPIEFGMFKMTIELLADGSPVMVSVFLDRGVNTDQFAVGDAQARRHRRNRGEQVGTGQRRATRVVWSDRLRRAR